MKVALSLAAALLIAALPLASPAAEAESPAGLYRATEGPDVASRLMIGADGHFRYELIAGALDQWARGEWRRLSDRVIMLTTRPEPEAPCFRVESMSRSLDASAPVSVHVTWPNGRGVAGIDVRIGLDDESVSEGYTQEDGWQAAPSDERRPLWIELREPIHGITLARTAIPEGRKELRFVLVPNDLGVVDFRDSPAQLDATRLILHTPRGTIRYIRVEEPEGKSEAGGTE